MTNESASKGIKSKLSLENLENIDEVKGAKSERAVNKNSTTVHSNLLHRDYQKITERNESNPLTIQKHLQIQTANNDVDDNTLDDENSSFHLKNSNIVIYSKEDRIEMPTEKKDTRYFKSVVRPSFNSAKHANDKEKIFNLTKEATSYDDTKHAIFSNSEKSSTVHATTEKITSESTNDKTYKRTSNKKKSGNLNSYFSLNKAKENEKINDILTDLNIVKEKDFSKASVEYINKIKELQKSKKRCQKELELFERFKQMINYSK